MEYDKPELQAEHGPFALVRTSSADETQFLMRAALATSDKDFYDQITSTVNAEDGTAVVVRAFAEHAMNNVQQNSFVRNIAAGVSKRRARDIKSQIAVEA